MLNPTEKPRCTAGTGVKAPKGPCAGVLTPVPVVNRGFSQGHVRFVPGTAGQNGQNREFLGKTRNRALPSGGRRDAQTGPERAPWVANGGHARGARREWLIEGHTTRIDCSAARQDQVKGKCEVGNGVLKITGFGTCFVEVSKARNELNLHHHQNPRCQTGVPCESSRLLSHCPAQRESREDSGSSC